MESFEIGGRTEIQTISFHTSEFVLYVYPLAGSWPRLARRPRGRKECTIVI